MCGISGFVDFSKQNFKSELEIMTDVLHHRGPDDSGYYFKEHKNFNLGLGHRRLSILDLSKHGHQPMHFNNLTIIYNGEVYNFNEIKNELKECGYEFESDTDTEVILKSFSQWGTEFVSRFRGMFVISIYDEKEKKLFIFRDRIGVKPLYYQKSKKSFIFASELKSFSEYKGFTNEIDIESLSIFLQFGSIHSPKTIYKNTYKLDPGHYIEFNLDSLDFDIKKYWDIETFYENKLNIKYEDAQNQLEELLVEAFCLRMISDVPVGTFLSGGVDSSLVTAILQKHSSSPIKTFTIGFENEIYNEAPFAKKIAEYLGTDHTEYICTKKDALNIIPKLSSMYDEPFADSSAIPTSLVSKLAKGKVSVILSGDGGDELFCGYQAYSLVESRLKKIKKIPFLGLIRKVLNIIPDPIFFLQNKNEKLYTRYLRFKDMLMYSDEGNAFKTLSSVFSKNEIELLLNDKYYFQENNENDKIIPIEKMMISDTKYYLPDDLLVKVDRATMNVSLEGREPFLDNKIVEFAASLPIEYKKNKLILKNILAKYIPSHLFERKKQGFGIPINDWLRSELKFLIDEYLNKDLIKEHGLFNCIYIDTLKEMFFNGSNDDRKIWTILMFQMWYCENIKRDNG